MHETPQGPPPIAMTDLGVLWKRKTFVLGATLLAAAMGYAAAFFIAPVYEAEASVQVGRVFTQDLEDSFMLTERINGLAFKSGFPDALREFSRRFMRAETIDTATKGQAAYVRITAQGRTPAQSLELVNRIAQRIIDDHRPLYDAALAQHVAYQKTLVEQLEASRQVVGRMETTLTGLSKAPGVGAPAVLLLQAQLESRQMQIIDMASRLRDARIQQANATSPTRLLAPPIEPQVRVWPQRTLIAAVAGGLAFLVAVLIVVLGSQASRRL